MFLKTNEAEINWLTDWKNHDCVRLNTMLRKIHGAVYEKWEWRLWYSQELSLYYRSPEIIGTIKATSFMWERHLKKGLIAKCRTESWIANSNEAAEWGNLNFGGRVVWWDVWGFEDGGWSPGIESRGRRFYGKLSVLVDCSVIDCCCY